MSVVRVPREGHEEPVAAEGPRRYDGLMAQKPSRAVVPAFPCLPRDPAVERR